MAIYISGVKNLPEQVQKNKDDIEDLQTAETNVEAKIDQEIADRKALIEASGNSTIIENPTENVAVSLNENETTKSFVVFINDTPKLNIDETSVVVNQDTAVNGKLEAYGDIKGHSDLEVSGDIAGQGDLDIDGNITAGGDIVGDSVSTTNNITAGGEVEGATLKAPIINVPDDINSFIINCKDSSNVNHILQFDADTQKLTIDNNNLQDIANFVDSQGNRRFIEGNLENIPIITGLTIGYAKWSLSGTHLMFVISGSIENATALVFTRLTNTQLPQYITDKIIPYGTGTLVERKALTLYASDNTTQQSTISLYKQNDDRIDISISAITLTADRNFRIQFDLLIDNE